MRTVTFHQRALRILPNLTRVLIACATDSPLVTIVRDETEHGHHLSNPVIRKTATSNGIVETNNIERAVPGSYRLQLTIRRVAECNDGRCYSLIPAGDKKPHVTIS